MDNQLSYRILTLAIIPELLLLEMKVEEFQLWRRSSQSFVKMTALAPSYTCRNFSQRWPSCHLQNSNLLPFPLLVQLHLHFSQGLLFSLWWNSNGTKIIFSFASTCTIGQGNFQCCSKTEGQHRCSLRCGTHWKHSFLSFAIWANHQTIKEYFCTVVSSFV